MATQSTSILLEEAGLAMCRPQSMQTCPEVLNWVYTAHYQHVLQVCRRFFRRPEDAEDAAVGSLLEIAYRAG